MSEPKKPEPRKCPDHPEAPGFGCDRCVQNLKWDEAALKRWKKEHAAWTQREKRKAEKERGRW